MLKHWFIEGGKSDLNHISTETAPKVGLKRGTGNSLYVCVCVLVFLRQKILHNIRIANCTLSHLLVIFFPLSFGLSSNLTLFSSSSTLSSASHPSLPLLSLSICFSTIPTKNSPNCISVSE